MLAFYLKNIKSQLGSFKILPCTLNLFLISRFKYKINDFYKYSYTIQTYLGPHLKSGSEKVKLRKLSLKWTL